MNKFMAASYQNLKHNLAKKKEKEKKKEDVSEYFSEKWAHNDRPKSEQGGPHEDCQLWLSGISENNADNTKFLLFLQVTGLLTKQRCSSPCIFLMHAERMMIDE